MKSACPKEGPRCGVARVSSDLQVTRARNKRDRFKQRNATNLVRSRSNGGMYHPSNKTKTPTESPKVKNYEISVVLLCPSALLV